MAAWDKLYKRETLNGIYFDKNTFNEDAQTDFVDFYEMVKFQSVIIHC